MTICMHNSFSQVYIQQYSMLDRRIERAIRTTIINMMVGDKLSVKRVMEICSILYPLVQSEFRVPFSSKGTRVRVAELHTYGTHM